METIDNINNFCIILTSTVYINPIKKWVTLTDPDVRLNIYLKSIKQWLDESNFKIVIVDNSGYTFPELNDYIDKYKERFEIVSFIEKDIDNAILDKVGAHAIYKPDDWLHTSKGISEMFAIYYACQHSTLVDKSKFIIKITCRYFIKELEIFLKDVNVDDYSALRQNDPKFCEIIGCHKNAVSRVFMPANFINIRGVCHHHIELLYEDRLLANFPQERVLVCDTFQIEPTQIGCVNLIKTEL